MWHLEHAQISPVLEIEHLLLSGSFRDIPVDSSVVVNTPENIQIVHSVTTNYSANSALTFVSLQHLEYGRQLNDIIS